MKKYIILLIVMFVGNYIIAQEETPVKKATDSLKTEVINVVTSYAPKVSDAFKIKRKPVIKLSKDVEKKKLDYTIISVPVASTFIPKSGSLKGIDVGKKERTYKNYVSVGFGNNITPFFEGFMHNVSRFDSEYGGNLKFIGSFDEPVKDAKLSSSYYNIDFGLFYMQEEHYFNWKIGVNAERDKYNWYGLPENINYTPATISNIKEEQTYKYYNVYGELDFPDSYFKDARASVGYFSDNFESNEFLADLKTLLAIPLGRVGYDLEDIYLDFSFKFLGGTFAHGYDAANFNEKKHQFLNAGINPYYKFNVANFDIKFGGKIYFSMDLQNSNNNFFFYPDVSVSYPVISKFANLYAGASGDLHQHSFKSFADKNPYVSPTVNIGQTNEVYNFFGGLKGILADNVNYNVKASFKHEESKALFALHPSKSNGNTTATTGGFPFFGYEYGNAFNVIYDDVKTISAFGEIEYDYNKNLTVGLNGEFNKYTLDLQQEAWNLPTLKGEVFAKYKTHKWYAGANIYYVGDRKGMQHSLTGDISAIDLKGYIDINVNGGYHFNPFFSVFVKVNNATNGSYQRFTNFNAQGIQAIGGFIYKFDSIF